jgi:hypothetical protein
MARSNPWLLTDGYSWATRRKSWEAGISVPRGSSSRFDLGAAPAGLANLDFDPVEDGKILVEQDLVPTYYHDCVGNPIER